MCVCSYNASMGWLIEKIIFNMASVMGLIMTQSCWDLLVLKTEDL